MTEKAVVGICRHMAGVAMEKGAVEICRRMEEEVMGMEAVETYRRRVAVGKETVEVETCKHTEEAVVMHKCMAHIRLLHWQLTSILPRHTIVPQLAKNWPFPAASVGHQKTLLCKTLVFVL